MKKLAFIFLSFIFLGGCTSEPLTDNAEAKTQLLTVVSSGDPVKVLPAFTSFSWSEDYSKVLSATNSQSELEIKMHIKEQIKKYLATKGYQYQADPIQADVVVGFLFALDNDIADADIQSKFGLLPGVSMQGVDNSRYEKGTFLLAILDNRLQTFYWRSAMQGFVDMESDKENEQSERFQFVLNMMMKDFPLAGK